MPGEFYMKGVHMICPRCNKPTLEEKDRNGVIIDVCQICRGIWLDRGELERLIAMADHDMERISKSYAQDKEHHGHKDHHNYHDRKHSHGNHYGHEGDHHYHHRKRSWLAEIFD